MKCSRQLSRFFLTLSFWLVAALPMQAQFSASPFTADDMLDVVNFAGGQPVTVSTDGKWAAYVLPDKSDEWNVLEFRPVGYVYVHSLEANGEQGRPLSQGEMRSSFPVWSPDGSLLAFYLEGPENRRLAIWNARSGEVNIYSRTFTGRAYLAPQWDPSGSRLYYAAAVAEEETSPPPRVRVVRSTDKRIPGDEFFQDKRRAQLLALDLESEKVEELTEEARLLRRFELSPSGRHVLYEIPTPETYGVIGEERNQTWLLALQSEAPPRKIGPEGARLEWTPDGEKALFRREGKLVAEPVDGGDPVPFLPGMREKASRLLWSPDGSQFVSLVPDPSVVDPEIEKPRPNMYSIARPFMDLYLFSAADGSSRNLTSEFEDQVSQPLWSSDGGSILFRAVDNRSYDEKLYRYRLDRQRLEVLSEGEESYDNLNEAGGRLLYTVQTATHPSELWVLELDSGQKRQVTRLNPQLSQFRFSKPRLFDFHNADGERLAALLYLPPGMKEGEKVPVITYVYEKLTPGIHRFSPRHQIFLTHGFAVLMPNVKIKVGQPGTSFVKSVVPAVNAVRDMGVSNGKFAMWGGSFGAFATSYVITQTDIFACAVSRATPPELFRNWASGRDRDSTNIVRGQARMGAGPFEAPERYLSQSAFFHLDKVNTPVLITHGVEDYTILFGEGEMMFYALRQLGKEAEFVIYTHGDHSLSRHSREDTIDVHRRMLDWFEKYLKP